MAAETFAEIESMDEIARHLGDSRKELLQTFAEHEKDRIDTRTARIDSGVEKSTRHHLKKLAQWGFLEEHDTRQYTPSGGSDSRVWSLTEHGQEFVEDYLGETVTTESVEDLTKRVNELEEKLAVVRGIVMKNGVKQGTVDKKEAKAIMGEEDFQKFIAD
jgi:predicted ArsR family transcriptional regulator